MTLLILLMAGGNVAYSALFPVLGEAQAGLGLDAGQLAVFLSAYAVAMLVMGPVGGWLSDRYGAAVVLPLAVACGAVGMGCVAVADGPVAAIAGRVLWGVGAGLQIAPYNQLAAAVAARSGVPAARVFSVAGAALMASLGVGPLLAGLLHPVMSFRGILAVIAACTVTAAVIGWYGLRAVPNPEPEPEDKGPSSGWVRPVILFGGFDLLIVVVETAMEPLVPLTLGTPGAASLVLTVGTAAYVVGVLAGGRLPRRFLHPGFALASMLCGACVVLLMPGVVAFALLNLCLAHCYLVIRECMSQDPAVTGRAWGMFGLFSGAGVMLGPVLGVAVHTLAPGAAFTLVAAAMVLGVAAFGLGLSGRSSPAGWPRIRAARGRHR
ncbi:MFS transporter [Nonomuraea sp. NPDC050556]|uniref:MFS transporter n=1 Tax=Nonomuraea sp. NPDC050556 TaxID=3364369 RepID=UPI0037BBA3AF